MFNNKLLFFIVLAATGCSVERDPQPAPAPSADVEQAIDASLPESTIMRVELDASGKPVKGTESLRYIATNTGANLATEFDSGKIPTQWDELDTETSTQSWYMTRLMQDDSSQSDQKPYNNQVPNQQIPNQQIPNQQIPNQQIPNQQVPNTNDNVCAPCPDQQQPAQGSCNCEEPAVQYRRGPSTVENPVSRRTVYEQRTRDVYPTEYVDVYPIETVRIHPTRTVTQVHPLQTQIEYVGNHCQDSSCSYGSQYYPTVQTGDYQQYYHYQSMAQQGQFAYYRYSRPSVFNLGGYGYGNGGFGNDGFGNGYGY